VVRVGATCLPHPALRGSLRVGGRGGVRGAGVGGWCAECRSGGFGGCWGRVAARPGVVLVLVSGGRCAGKVVGNFPGRPGGSPRASSLFPLRYAAGDSTQLAQWSGSGGPVG
jgi:hypothetical protein